MQRLPNSKHCPTSETCEKYNENHANIIYAFLYKDQKCLVGQFTTLTRHNDILKYSERLYFAMCTV